jgi:hypothetical protein
MCKDFHTWSDKGQKRFLQAIEKIKERSKEGAPIYAQMSRLGLAASKEVRIKKRLHLGTRGFVQPLTTGYKL